MTTLGPARRRLLDELLAELAADERLLRKKGQGCIANVRSLNSWLRTKDAADGYDDEDTL